MRKIKTTKGEYYHIFNRGNNKQLIFKDERDRIRFLFLILYFQSPVNFYNIGRQVSHYVKHQVFNTSEKTLKQIIDNRYIEIVSFTLMPNHFHLIIHETNDGGISRFIQRILNSHAKYFNTKHNTSGHLFQGPFKTVYVEKDNQLLYLSAYIHRNIREIREWTNKENLYPWSSYQDFIGENRWGELLKPEIIIDQFPSKDKYKLFVENSGVKDLPIDKKLLIDID